LLSLLLLALAIILFLGRKYYILQHNSKRQTDSILNNIQDGVYRCDLDGNLIWVSPSALKILGVDSLEKVEHANVNDFYVDSTQREELLRRLREDGKAENYETLLERMDGRQIFVNCNASYWRDDNGKILGIEGVFRDITEQKRTKEALVESEEKYRSLVEGAAEAIFSVNYDGVFLFMNKIAAGRLDGIPENFIGKTMWDLFPKHIADSQIVSIRNVFDSGIGRSSETVTILKGKKHKYITNLQPIKGNSGKISSVLGVAQDITSFVKAQQDLEIERDFVKSLIETASSLIVCLDKYATITMFNKAIEKLTGYSRDEVLGKSWADIFLPEDHCHHKINNFEDWIRKHPIDSLEGQIKTKSGELRTILWSNSTFFHPDSDDFTVIVVGQDITDRKIAEQERIESETRFNESLEYSRDILYRLNLKTNTYDYMSEAVFDISGFTPEEIIAGGADGVNARVHPDDRALHINYRNRLTESDWGERATYYIESRIKTKNGQYIWLGDRHVLVRDTDGEPLYIVGCARDITGQKKTEIRQKARLELLNNLRHTRDIDFCLELGCRAVYDSGLFERAVLTMHNDKKEIINIGYFGLEKAIVDAARNAPAPGDELIKKMTMDEFRISNSYFIPVESGVFETDFDRRIAQDHFENADDFSWRTGDELFVPVINEQNKIDGWLSVDTPFDRNRPTLETVGILEEIVDIVTQKIREIETQAILWEKHKALVESEKKYRQLIDSSPDATAIFQNGRIVLINSAFVKLLGYTLEEMGGEDGFMKIIQKDELKTVLQRMKERQAGKKLSKVFVVTLVSKDGREIPCETSNSQIQYQGQAAQFITMRDISERKKMIDALLQSEKFSRAIIKYSPIGISVRSHTGKLLSANKAWRNIWGHTEEEMTEFMTRERDELKFDYCDEYLGRWLPALERVYKEGGYLHVPDIQVTNPRRKDTLYVSQHFYAIKDSSGKVDRVVILTEDITERRIAEEKIKSINMEKLEQAKRIAGTFAHEIRNALFPASASLNRIKLSSQTNDNNYEELKKYSAIAERSITRAADITGLISSYTKLDTELMPEQVNLNEVFEELLTSNKLKLDENNVQIDISGNGGRPVKSNRRQLLLAFNNILLNSIDAFEDRENRRITIEWASNGDSQEITFKDNGCGIPSEYIGRIFEPFFSKKSDSGGTGLGLAMTKRIIEMYGGSVSVQSIPAVGTTFRINLGNYESNSIGNIGNSE